MKRNEQAAQASLANEEEGVDWGCEDEEWKDGEVVWTTIIVSMVAVPFDSVKTTFPHRIFVKWFYESLFGLHLKGGFLQTIFNQLNKSRS